MAFDSNGDMAFEGSAPGRLYARNKPGCLALLIATFALVGWVLYRQLAG
jgi:hypothetical protein